MYCKHCGSPNIQAVPKTSGEIKGRGCLMTLVHIVLTFFTCGLWLLVLLIRGGSHGKIQTKTEFRCLSCGAKVRR